MSGLACGLAAVLWTARFATAHPGAAQGLELDVIAVVVLGGTRITGGAGSVVGTFLGLVLLGLLRYGLDMNSVPQQDQTVVVGVLLVLIAALNEAWAARSER
jgi:ribose transport system permease protein